MVSLLTTEFEQSVLGIRGGGDGVLHARTAGRIAGPPLAPAQSPIAAHNLRHTSMATHYNNYQNIARRIKLSWLP